MHDELKCKLDAIRKQSEDVYKNSNDIDEIKKKVLNELVCYTHIIPEFFSYDREAIKIKELYKKLKDLDFTRNKVISCVDICKAGCTYNEYFEGMVTFINDFISKAQAENEDLTLIEKQLQTAIQGDPLFIDSLFGGKNNEPVEEELTDAIKNVEYLVDYFETLKTMTKTVSDICERANMISSKYEYIINAIKLIANSTGAFSCRVIASIVDIYDCINERLDNRPVKAVDSTFKVF